MVNIYTTTYNADRQDKKQERKNKQTHKRRGRKGKKNEEKKNGRKKRWKNIGKVLSKNCLKYDYSPITHNTNTHTTI